MEKEWSGHMKRVNEQNFPKRLYWEGVDKMKGEGKAEEKFDLGK